MEFFVSNCPRINVYILTYMGYNYNYQRFLTITFVADDNIIQKCQHERRLLDRGIILIQSLS